MRSSPWTERVALALLGACLWAAVAAHWWMPRPFPG